MADKPKINSRRRLDPSSTYFESDKDYVLNNLPACVEWLDSQGGGIDESRQTLRLASPRYDAWLKSLGL